MELKKKKLRRRARRVKQVRRGADPIAPPARKAGLRTPVESLAPPSPDVEVLIKNITGLSAELGWRVEFGKLLVRGERHKCDPAAWPPGFAESYARESLLWLKLMSGRGIGSPSWVGDLAKERWGPSFADSDPWHDTQWQGCCARLKDQMGAGLVPRTRAWLEPSCSAGRPTTS